MNCLETNQLSHFFSNEEKVLDNIGLKVPEGAIYGFLGPNGAGKTTTLRLILGLLKKQQGQISIFGKSFENNRVEILQNIGSLIEAPSMYAHLTARENLVILQKIYNCPVARIGEVLALVDLSNTGKKKAGKFSLGMKQRLSIAMALLHHPKLLILDEPTNGLDPNGIIEMRELLKKLNREEGVTILVSSHLLAEVERLVTHLGIISKGKLVFQGSMEELMLAQTSAGATEFITDKPGKTLAIVEAFNFKATVINDGVHVPSLSPEHIAKINSELVRNNIAVYGIREIKNDLESIFIDLVKN